MIEKDNIQELFSKSLESHTMPVRPELWAGVQAKMAAAATASTATAVASKGVSLLTKWIVGGLITSSAVVVAVVATTNDDAPTKAKQEQIAENTTATSTSDDATEDKAAIKINDSKEKTTSTTTKKVATIGGITPVVNEATRTKSVTYETPPIETPRKENSTAATPVKTPVAPAEAKPQKQEPVVPKKVVEDKRKEDEPIKPVSPAATSQVKVDIEFPNVFTPNNDGVHDEYFLKTVENVSTDDFTVTIMDASNHVVWKDENPNFKWDGIMMSNEKAPDGKYICIIVGKDTNGKQFSKYNTFQIITKD